MWNRDCAVQITSAKTVTIRNNVFLNNFCYPYTYLDQVSGCHEMPRQTKSSKPHVKHLRHLSNPVLLFSPLSLHQQALNLKLSYCQMHNTLLCGL